MKVAASPINPADLLRIRGLYGHGASAPTLPFSAGIEGVGHVEAVGAEVTNVKPGDLVTLARIDGIWGPPKMPNSCWRLMTSTFRLFRNLAAFL